MSRQINNINFGRTSVEWESPSIFEGEFSKTVLPYKSVKSISVEVNTTMSGELRAEFMIDTTEGCETFNLPIKAGNRFIVYMMKHIFPNLYK